MLRSLGKFILAGAAAASIAGAVPAQAADDEVKIGLLFDVTGPVANFVPPMLDAAKLAVDQVNAQGGILGGKKLVTVVADTQGSPQVAVDAANKLVNAEKVATVIGALLSGTTLASAQSVIVPAGVVQISPTATTPVLSSLKDNDWVFRVVPSDSYQGPVLAKMLMDKGITSVALTYANNDYAVGIAETFRAAYKKLGGTITADIRHEEKKSKVGRPETWKQAFYGRDLAGTVVLVGVPTPTMQLEMPLLDFFGRGGSLKSAWYGDCLPGRDFPVLSNLFLQGRLPLDKFVSETIGIGDIEAAFDKMHTGDVLRSVVVL